MKYARERLIHYNGQNNEEYNNNKYLYGAFL